ncbi:MAG: hypothetical protein M3Y07_15020 [Acidobacteriota bacterium]|nr:hypothetical protein [Acidobacteriota bacterium]
MIAAILRAQLLSMRSFRLRSRMGGSIFSALTGLIFYGFWAVLAFGAEAFFSNADNRELFPIVLSTGLMIVFLYWQLAPVATASMGSSLDLRKLLVYPVPHEKLFFVEVLLRFTTCAEMVIVLAGAFIGLLRNPVYGGAASLPRLVFPILLFIALNVLLSAGSRNLLERLLLHKRLREFVVLLMVLAGAVPQLLLVSGVRRHTVERFLPMSAIWPWSALSSLLLSAAFTLPVVILLIYVVAAYLFSRWQFQKSLRADHHVGSSVRPAEAVDGRPSLIERLYRLPSALLPDPLAAMVEKEIRSLSRTPRFRLVFIMGFSFGLIVWLPTTLRHRASTPGFMSENFLTVVSIYALILLGQVSYWNSFGFDRSAAQVYFSLPVPFSKALAGKNIAAAVFICIEVCFVVLVTLIFRIHLVPIKILEALAVSLTAGFYLLSVGNLSSVHFPRPMTPEKVTQGGAARSLNALVFLFFPLALAPIGLAYWARYVFDSQAIFFAMLALAALVGGVIYWISMESAVGHAQRNREKILAELSRGDGPLIAE